MRKSLLDADVHGVRENLNDEPVEVCLPLGQLG